MTNTSMAKSPEFDEVADHQFRKVLSILAITQPFFSTILLGMEIRQDHDFPTLYTNADATILGYNPEFFKSLGEKFQQSAVAHEALHPALLHTFRRNDRDPLLWNMAGDYALNLLLKESRFSLPDSWLCDDKYKDMTAEQIYPLLVQERDKALRDFQQGQGQGQDGEGSDSFSSDPQDHIESSYSGNEWKHDKDCGCGYVNAKQEAQSDKSEKVASETRMKARVTEAASAAKAAGNFPAGLARFVDGVLNPQVPWTDYLRDLAEMLSKNDFTYTRPSYRYLPQGFYLPSIHSMEMGPIAVSMDTSGSMGQQELEEAAAEVAGILNQLRPEKVVVLFCDADVANVQEITPDEYPIRLEPQGGGGTSFKPTFEWIEKSELEPVCHIYLTDMYCNDFAKQPDHPVYWCVLGDNKHTIAPYGTMIWTQ